MEHDSGGYGDHTQREGGHTSAINKGACAPHFNYPPELELASAPLDLAFTSVRRVRLKGVALLDARVFSHPWQTFEPAICHCIRQDVQGVALGEIES